MTNKDWDCSFVASTADEIPLHAWSGETCFNKALETLQKYPEKDIVMLTFKNEESAQRFYDNLWHKTRYLKRKNKHIPFKQYLRKNVIYLQRVIFFGD